MTQGSATQRGREQAADKNAIRPFPVASVPEAELTDLRKRINNTRWPERETVTDATQGMQLATTQALARYWATDYDWRKCEAKLQSLPNFSHSHRVPKVGVKKHVIRLQNIGVNMRVSLFSLALLAVAIPASTAFSQSFPPGVTPVAGAVMNVSSSEISLQTQQGPVTVHLVQPATVYEGQPSDMSHISANSYIGVGSVKGADGKEHATDIKIFPEAFRGLAEGSYMQPAQSGAPSNSRMTNGAVTASSKGKSATSGSRMTNGAVTKTGSGSELTVGGVQIEVPAGTPVILIAATKKPLQPGQHVLIPAKKQDDGSFDGQTILVLPAK
jgi:hypothetical protein